MYLIYLLKLAASCPIVRGSQRQFKPKRTSTAYDFRMRCGLQAWPRMSIVPPHGWWRAHIPRLDLQPQRSWFLRWSCPFRPAPLAPKPVGLSGVVPFHPTGRL